MHKQLGFGKLNVKSPSKECKQLLKEKQEEKSKASNEALERFEVALGKLTERLSNAEETFLLALATTAFVEAGKGLIAFNFGEERGNKMSWMEVEMGLEELVVALREKKSGLTVAVALERVLKLQDATQEYKASGQHSCQEPVIKMSIFRQTFKFTRI